MPDKIKIGYWNIRGLGQPIKYQLAYQGIDYDLENYEVTADEATTKCWRDVKFTLGYDFPNLPYMDDNGFKLTEHMAIHYYLADKYNPELRGETP